MRELLSVFIKNNSLYLYEKEDEVCSIRVEEYDKPPAAAYNMPSSRDIILPTDQVELNQYGLTFYDGIYDFVYQHGEPNGYLTYIHDTKYKKDVFLFYNFIVHVQDYETKTTEDKVIDEIIDGIKYTDHTPESFLDLVNEKLAKSGIDLEKELENMVFEKPKEEIVVELESPETGIVTKEVTIESSEDVNKKIRFK